MEVCFTQNHSIKRSNMILVQHEPQYNMATSMSSWQIHFQSLTFLCSSYCPQLSCFWKRLHHILLLPSQFYIWRQTDRFNSTPNAVALSVLKIGSSETNKNQIKNNCLDVFSQVRSNLLWILVKVYILKQNMNLKMKSYFWFLIYFFQKNFHTFTTQFYYARILQCFTVFYFLLRKATVHLLCIFLAVHSSIKCSMAHILYSQTHACTYADFEDILLKAISSGSIWNTLMFSNLRLQRLLSINLTPGFWNGVRLECSSIKND